MSIIENALKKSAKQTLINNIEKDSVVENPLLSDEFNVTRVESLMENNIHVIKTSSEPDVLINWDKLTKDGFIDRENTKSQLAEEFRVIKRPLVNNIQGRSTNGINHANLILICSSLPGEGKTFVSINLALSLANERDKSVLLIDADVEKPSISKQLGIKPTKGLIEYLEDPNVNFSEICLRTDSPNLSIIPAGKRHNYSTELLSSQRMYLFAEEISRRYQDRIVIFDSPPLLVATQAPILAELVGQVVLVVGAEETPQNIVNEAVAKLSKCDVVMTLLNKTRRDIDVYGYSYGYGHYGHSS